MEKIPYDYRGIPAHLKQMQRMDSKLGAAAYAFSRLRAKCRRHIAVNAFGGGEEQVSLSFLTHPLKEKSDGFILTARTQKELEVWISDGGFATEESLGEILALREKLLALGNLAHEANNPRYKLEVTYLVSHFHIDHVNEGIYHILPCPFIHVKRLIYPQITSYVKEVKDTVNCNGDDGIRTRFMLSLKAYQPLAEKVLLPFGDCRTLPFGAGTVTLMMPDRDWGLPEYRGDLARFYGYNDMSPAESHKATAVQVVNSNCIVARIEYASRSMLLTGDAMKKTYEYDDEPFDRIVKQYGDRMRADIVKYPHHGQKRNPAWKVVRDQLLIPGPDAMVVLTGNDGFNQSGPLLTKGGVPWMDIRESTLNFIITKDGAIRRTQGPAAEI